MNRRQLLATLGTATGVSTILGTGAFTSTSADRNVSVQVAGDANAFLGLVPGDTDLVTEDDGTLQVSLDDSTTGASGVNLNAVTQIGSNDNPATSHAFKIINQGTQSLMLKMNYYFTDTGWIDGAVGQSFIKFTLHDTSGGQTGSSSQNFPKQNGFNNDFSLGQPTGGGFGSNAGSFRFNVGEEYFMVVTVDTTGPRASKEDDLSGIAEFVAKPKTEQDKYDRGDPPI